MPGIKQTPSEFHFAGVLLFIIPIYSVFSPVPRILKISILKLSGLINPAKLEAVTNTLQAEWQKTPENVAKWMMDRGIKWSKEQIININKDQGNKIFQDIDISISYRKRQKVIRIQIKTKEKTGDEFI